MVAWSDLMVLRSLFATPSVLISVSNTLEFQTNRKNFASLDVEYGTVRQTGGFPTAFNGPSIQIGARMNFSLPVSPCSSPLRQFGAAHRSCLPSPPHPAFTAGTNIGTNRRAKLPMAPLEEATCKVYARKKRQGHYKCEWWRQFPSKDLTIAPCQQHRDASVDDAATRETLQPVGASETAPHAQSSPLLCYALPGKAVLRHPKIDIVHHSSSLFLTGDLNCLVKKHWTGRLKTQEKS
ncbi:hypothetical protein ACLOJK_013934 [Asimina triloba]